MKLHGEAFAKRLRALDCIEGAMQSEAVSGALPILAGRFGPIFFAAAVVGARLGHGSPSPGILGGDGASFLRATSVAS